MSDPDKTVLIVDDEPDMCWALEHLLHRQGFFTHKALTGKEALELLRSRQCTSVFLDAKLPDMDGLELAGQMRQIDPNLRIVMVSGYFYRDDIAIQKAISLGLIANFISKPFLKEEILKSLNIL